MSHLFLQGPIRWVGLFCWADLTFLHPAAQVTPLVGQAGADPSASPAVSTSSGRAFLSPIVEKVNDDELTYDSIIRYE